MNLKEKTKLKKEVKGITLIALVVIIIVLLILAGVAINLSIGQNGIFSRAQDAANTWRNAETDEQLALQEGADIIDNYIYNTATTVLESKIQNKFFKEDTTIKDELDNYVKVPAGFKISNDSATKVEYGVVIEDKDGNQFVWIPAKTGEGVIVHTESKGDIKIVYNRTAYSTNASKGEIDSATNSEKILISSSSSYYYAEKLPEDEEESIDVNGGYYIGRYEAGDKESTEEKEMRTSSSSQINNITVKKDQVPYNYITKENCENLAKKMSEQQGYKAKTKLASSYAWDTAISLMQITNEDYGNSSIEGNYKNTSFSYRDLTGTEQTKNNGSATLVPTGQTLAVCNIYDMGGNLWEYTTESSSKTNVTYAYCGGYCGCSYNQYGPSGYRDSNNGDAYSNGGFRVTLYL